jgi:hypothetical protein
MVWAARRFAGSVFEVKHGERQAERIEDAHPIVFAHPRLAEGRQSRGKLGEAAGNCLRDLVLGTGAGLSESVP